MKKRLFSVLRILITIALLFFLFRNLNFGEFWNSLRSIDLNVYIFAFFLLFLNSVLLSERTRGLFSAFNKKLGFFFAFKYYLIGIFFNQVLPTSVGGDAIKGYHMGKRTGSGSTGLLIVLIDRIIGLITMILYLFVAVLLGGLTKLDNREGIFLVVMAFLILVLCLLLFSKKVMSFFYRNLIARFEKKFNFIEKIKQAYLLFLESKSKKDKYIMTGIISILGQVLMIFCAYYVSRSLNINVKLMDYFIVMPIIFVVSMLPISIGGFGVREGAFVYLLGRYGVASETAMSMALLFIALFVIISIPGGIFYLFKDRGEING